MERDPGTDAETSDGASAPTGRRERMASLFGGPPPLSAALNGVPAPMGRRIVAYLIDRIFIYSVTFAAALPYIWRRVNEMLEEMTVTVTSDSTVIDFYTDFFLEVGMRQILEMMAVVVAIFAATSAVYTLPQVALWGQTVGKRVGRLYIVNRQGDRRVGWATSLYRWCLPSISAFLGGMGSAISLGAYAWAFTNPERRGAHDIVAGTTVVDAETFEPETLSGDGGADREDRENRENRENGGDSGDREDSEDGGGREPEET